MVWDTITEQQFLERLDTSPKFRDEVRRRVLSAELIAMPENLAETSAQLAKLSKEFGTFAGEQRTINTELRTDITELRTDVAELKEGQAELRADVNELKEGQTEIKTRSSGSKPTWANSRGMRPIGSHCPAMTKSWIT